jgi:hypothetical protein
MLEAVHTDLVFTISLKRSTQNLQRSTSYRPITPSIEDIAGFGWPQGTVVFLLDPISADRWKWLVV